MAVVSCPKCSAGLRVPDGSTAAVRCPKCTTVFQPPKPAAASGFEVVDDAPAKASPRAAAPRPAAPPPPPPPPPPTQKKAFSLDDAVRSADARPRRADRDEDDDRRDRDRSRRGRDDDDDDRPRGRSRRDDDDDYDDRRDRRRRDNYADDDDWDRDDDRDRRRKPSRFGLARPGALLLLISLGFYFGGMALHALFVFVAWVGGVIPHGLTVMTGILGLIGWLVALVGLGLTIAGPAKSRGLAIAATAVAAVHLVLAFVVANDRPSAGYGMHTIPMRSAMNRIDRLQDLNKELAKEMQANPNGQRVKDLRAELADSGRDAGRIGDSDGGMRWHDMVTDLPRLDMLVGVLSYRSRGFEYYLWGLFAGLFELARLILLGLLLGSLARAAKDHRSADQAKFGWIAGAAAVGIGLLVVVLAMVVAESAAKDAARAVTDGAAGSQPPQMQVTPGGNIQQQHAEHQRQMEDWRRQQEGEREQRQQRVRSAVRAPLNYLTAAELLVYTLHAGALVLPALASLGVFRSMGRRR